jgi:DNA polymerase III epsilon subunit family exonuclease
MTARSPAFRRNTSALTRRLEEILRERERLPAQEACRLLLQSPRVPALLAARLVQEMVSGDHRFQVGAGGEVTLAPEPPFPALRLREARFTVLDLETTGGSPAADRILEIGAVKVAGGRLEESFSTLLNPGVPIPPFISSMTGIRAEMVAQAPSFLAVAEQVAGFIGDSVLVAHNLPFDMGFLNRELERNCGFILANPALCTVRLGRKLLPGLPNRRLDTLAEHYGLTFAGRHRALGDAEVTARLLVKFIGLLEEMGMEDLRGVGTFLGNDPGPAAEAPAIDPVRRRRQDSPPFSSAGS